MGAPGSRTLRGLAPIERYARRHWRGVVLSVLIMAFQSAASASRIVLLLPIFTRVLQTETLIQGTETNEEAERLQARIEAIRSTGGRLVQGVDDVVDRVNGWTGRLVPEAWLERSVVPDASASARAVTREVERDRYATLLSVVFLFVLFTLVMALATYGEGYVAESVRLRILMDVREDLCRKLLDQPVAFYDQRRRGELVQRVLGDVDGYAIGINLLLTGVVKGALALLTTLVLMALLSWQLTLILFLGAPFLLPMRRLFKRILRRAHKRQKESERRVEVLLQMFSGIRTVKAFGLEGRRVSDFRTIDEGVSQRSLAVQRAKSSMDALTELINNVLAVLFAVGGAWLILRGYLPVGPGELVAFLALTINLYQPLKRFVKQYSSLQDALASIERTTEYLSLPAGSPDRAEAVAFPGLHEGIRFENLSFAYEPEQPVLHDVSFEVPRGATVALVGPSGAGKSTLCDLLLRFYDPDEGRITVDGRDLRDVQRRTLLDRCAVVTQSPFLFHASIRENIRQGKPDASDQEIEDAARAAWIHDFVAQQPEGYDSVVGEQGVRLSGGQRQRITIARALVRDPEILVLDEATSSLDTASERAVQEALERLQRGRTTLVVAHRLSTIRHADRIVVLDHGRVVEEGTHDELVARDGLYAELVRMQDLGRAPAS